VDVTWQANPPNATILQAQDLPAEGGDTVWSTSAGAYDLLDAKLAACLETLTAVTSLEVTRLPEYLTGTYGGRYPAKGGKQRLAVARAAHPPIEVPVIASHPETGRRVINVNEGHTSHLKNLSRVPQASPHHDPPGSGLVALDTVGSTSASQRVRGAAATQTPRRIWKLGEALELSLCAELLLTSHA
jgi:Taurine catabolism dioxygenase TauD, TfdA family